MFLKMRYIYKIKINDDGTYNKISLEPFFFISLYIYTLCPKNILNGREKKQTIRLFSLIFTSSTDEIRTSICRTCI